jgi:hypothetical protein
MSQKQHEIQRFNRIAADQLEKPIPENVSENLTTIVKQMKKAINKINKCKNKTIMKEKREIIHARITDLINSYWDNPRKFFKNLLRRFDNNSIDAIRDTTDKTIIYTSSEEILNVLEQFTKYIYETKIKPRLDKLPEWYRTQPTIHSPYDLMKYIDKIEFQDALTRSPRYKTPGVDLTPIEIIQSLDEKSQDVIRLMFNQCLKNRQIPKIWKQTEFILIYKKLDRLDIENYRPIALQCAQYKLFTNILTNRLTNYFENNNLLSKLQAGFRKNHATYDQILSLINTFEDRKQYSKYKEIHACFLDLKKAFDSVEHWGIKQSLEHYQVQDSFIELVMNMYRNCAGYIRTYEHGNTKSFPLTKGIRQGDCLSPLLFIIFLNPFLTWLERNGTGYKFYKDHKINIPGLAYADDLVLISDSRAGIETEFKIFAKFCRYYGLEINTKKDKSAYMTIGIENCNQNDLFSLTNYGDLHARGFTIKKQNSAESYRYLGILINLKLDWKADVTQIIKNFQKYINMIKTRAITPNMKVEIINRVLNPALEYHLGFYELHKENVNLLNDLATNVIKHNIPAPSTIANDQFWADRPSGGFDMDPATLVNDYSLAVSVYEHGLISLNPITRLTTHRRVKDNPHLIKTQQTDLNTLQNADTKLFVDNRTSHSEFLITKYLKVLNRYNLQNISNEIDTTKLTHAFDKKHNYLIEPLLSRGIKDFDLLLQDDGKTLLSNHKIYERLFKPTLNCLQNAQYMKDFLDQHYKWFCIKLEKIRNHITDKNTHKLKPYLNQKGKRGIDIAEIKKWKSDEFNELFTFDKQKKEIYAWTDGSLEKTKTKAGCGIHFKTNSRLNTSFRTRQKQTVFISELEAIEYAIIQTPIDWNLVIFSDCKNAVDKIKNILLTNSKPFLKPTSKEGRLILNRIWELNQNRTSNIGTSITIEHIYSHVEQKRKKYLKTTGNTETDEKRKTKLLRTIENIKYLQHKYPHLPKQIFTLGNDKADENAKTGCNLPKLKNYLPKGMDAFMVLDKNEVIETKIRRTIREKFKNKIKAKWNRRVVQRRNVQINQKYSYCVMRNDLPENAERKKFLVKIRNGQLKGAHKMFKMTKYKNLPEEIKRELKKRYKNSKCSLCGAIKDTTLHILKDCPAGKKSRIKLAKSINNFLTREGYDFSDIAKFLFVRESENLLLTKNAALAYFNEQIVDILMEKSSIQKEKLLKKQVDGICKNLQTLLVDGLREIHKNRWKQFLKKTKNNRTKTRDCII